MQKQEMKDFIALSALSQKIPQSDKMVKVASLLTAEDLERIDEYSIGTIAVKVGSEALFLSKEHSVPSHATIQRDAQGLLLGIPAVSGG